MNIAEMRREPAVEDLARGHDRHETGDRRHTGLGRRSRQALLWRFGFSLDLDYTAGNGFQMIQATQPGSGCSVIFGKNVTTPAPRSASYSTTRAAFCTKPVRKAWSAVQIRHEKVDARRLPSRFIKP
jgi:hypothetical protein